MKNTFKKWMALSLALITLAGSAASCKSKNKTTADAGQSSLPSVSEDGSITTTPSAGESALFVPFTYTDMGYTDHAALSRLAAGEGMVLLENENNALPLKKGESVALFGKGQIDFYKGGTGSGDVNAPYVVNLLEGMREKAKEGKITLYEELAEKYEKNSGISLPEAMVKQASKKADAAVMVVSRNTGEMYDRGNGFGDFRLSSAEMTLLEQIGQAGFEKIVVVLNIPAVIDTSFMESIPAIDALLVAWQPGMEGGSAVADILCGDVNPSGKLADTIAASYAGYVTAKTFNRNGKSEYYYEDIYVGYRYFETFDPDYKTVRYPFGYGLSYTDFEISNVKTECDGVYVKVSAEVKNVGKVAGKEVLQVYYSAPQGKLGNPAKELAGYVKTALLEPGKSQTVGLSFALSDMASYDDTGKVAKSAYLLEKGVDPALIGYPPRLLAGIPGLCEEGFLKMVDGKPALNVPRLTHAQAEDLFARICRPCAKEIADALTEPLGEYLRTHKVRIPAHLDSVPEQKLTMPHEPPAMGFVFGAIRAGLHKRDLGNCPETVLIFD